MIDADKVLIGLGQHISGRTVDRCGSCPYFNGDSGYGISCRDELLDDLYELLEAQEEAQGPRVLNVGDFYGEEFGYLEYRTVTPGFSNFEPSPVLISDIDEENVTVIFRSGSVQKLPLDTLNKRWRIWSDYPTHELLKEVKWRGDD